MELIIFVQYLNSDITAHLVEALAVQNRDRDGAGSDQEGVEITPPRWLVSLNKVNQEIDDLRTGKLEEDEGEVEDGGEEVGGPEGPQDGG